MKHHEDAIARYVERRSQDPSTLGIVITGSIARHTERPGSDVDLYLVVTENAWAEARAHNRLMYVDRLGADYEGGYFDVKLATLSYLDDAADRGDDPVRDSFAHSWVAFTRVDDLHTRVRRAAEVPEEHWIDRQRSFIAQSRLYGGYFLEQATESGDPLLSAHAAIHLAVAASRALFAFNRVLFQGPKYLGTTLATLRAKPERFDELVVELIRQPRATSGRAVLDALESFTDWGLPDEETLSTFVLDNELAWRYRTKTPEYS